MGPTGQSNLNQQPSRNPKQDRKCARFWTLPSAFDAHMLLIEVHGKRILYPCDFKAHGRKSSLTRRLMAAPPKNIDMLLMAGTNLGSDKSCITESDLEDSLVDLFRSTPARAFVAWSAQSVDRTLTPYRACLKSGRTLVIDLYTAKVMEALAEFGMLPRPGWNNLKVVISVAFACEEYKGLQLKYGSARYRWSRFAYKQNAHLWGYIRTTTEADRKG